MPHAGKIISEWKSPHGTRQNSSKSVEEFEKSVLFQIALSSGEKGKAAVKEIREAVIVAASERPAPERQPEVPPKRRKPKVRQHRRSRRPPRR
jgi:hypothetical protein